MDEQFDTMKKQKEIYLAEEKALKVETRIYVKGVLNQIDFCFASKDLKIFFCSSLKGYVGN